MHLGCALLPSVNTNSVHDVLIAECRSLEGLGAPCQSMLQGGMAMGLRSRPSRAADADMDKAVRRAPPMVPLPSPECTSTLSSA